MSETVSKLSVELKNAPRDASQVPCSVNDLLNREETLGASRTVLADNLGDENRLPVKRERQNLRVSVYVLNMRGQPLMPITPRKARILLKQEKVRVVQRTPFVIQLKYPTGETKQDITLGIDAGYSKIGFSAVTNKRELIAGEFTLRRDVSKKLDNRRMYRGVKRNRLWHRKPRFDNRKESKPKGWLAPSIQHKLDTHVRLVDKIKKLLPISKTIVEVASFDTQKMENPEIKGVEYQQGTLFGYTVRNYLLEKWKHKCAYCKKGNIPLQVDHIIPKSRSGSNRIFNLTIACQECNLKKGNQTAEEFGYPNVQKQAKQPLKATAFMNNVRWKMIEQLNCQHTYGDKAKFNRVNIGLPKSHVNDAFVIAGGKDQEFSKIFEVKQVRRNNRCLQKNRKGYRPSIRRQRYKLQVNDLVRYNNVTYYVKGVFNYGKSIRLMDKFKNTVNSNIKNVELIQYGKGIQFT